MMKQIAISTVVFLGLIWNGAAFSETKKAPAKVRQIAIKTEKIGDAVHWMPAKIEVAQGESVEFLVSHEAPGGFDFHGFNIPILKIEKQVNRGPAMSIPATIPKDLKIGDYKIGCQFHPKHVPATLVVTGDPSSVKDDAKAKNLPPQKDLAPTAK